MAFGLVSWGVTTAGDYVRLELYLYSIKQIFRYGDKEQSFIFLKVMAGFDTVRRHGLLLSKGVKERKFVSVVRLLANSK